CAACTAAPSPAPPAPPTRFPPRATRSPPTARDRTRRCPPGPSRPSRRSLPASLRVRADRSLRRLPAGGELVALRVLGAELPVVRHHPLAIDPRLLERRHAVVLPHRVGPGVVRGEREQHVALELIGQPAQVARAAHDVL